MIMHLDDTPTSPALPQVSASAMFRRWLLAVITERGGQRLRQSTAWQLTAKI
jgi:hypothetical protein